MKSILKSNHNYIFKYTIKKKDKTQCCMRGLEMKSTNLLGFF